MSDGASTKTVVADDETEAVDTEAVDTNVSAGQPDTGGDGGAPEDADEDEDDDGGGGGDARLSWGQVAVLGVALAFLGFAVGIFVSRDNPPGADSTDVGFYQDMISHHDQAIQMATLAVPKAENPTVRGFASDVLAFQEWEMGVMDRTLHEWGYSRADRSPTAMQWMGMAVPVEEMPGMATEEEMQALTDASGLEFDTMFLQLMADHHSGGLHMAEYAAANADDHDVRELAARMARNQAIEINEYVALGERAGLDLDIERVPVPEGPETDH